MPVQLQSQEYSFDTTAGTMATRDGNLIPLLAVDIDASVHDAISHLTIRQVFRNRESVPIEALYSFPVGEMSALHRLEVRIGNRLVRAAIDEKKRALEMYDEALAAGNRAILLDQDRPNILTMSLGNLLPGEEAVVTIGTASELERHGDSLRLLIPTTISPRYVPAEQAAVIDPSELDALGPPLRDGVPYGLRLRAAIRGSSGVREVECVSHPVRTELVDGGALVTLSDPATALDQDVVISIRFKKPHESTVLVGRDGAAECIAALEFRPVLDSFARQPCEVIFLVDRSGSMGGESIEQARCTLQICLRSLVEGDFFNIVGFGSEFESLFKTSVSYGQATLDAASRHVDGLDADLGGTEMLAPLQFILEHKALARRRIVLITDGQVSNEDDVANLASRHPETAIFTVGIGRGVNEHLARIVARMGGGAVEFVFPGERIEEKVMRQFGRITGPTLTDVRLTFEGATPSLMTPDRIGPISQGAVLRLYARLPHDRHVRATLHAVGPDGPLTWTQEFSTGNAVNVEALPALLARAAIREIEEGREESSSRRSRLVTSRIVELSRRYGILSSETSFIGVEVLDDADPDKQPELRQVPVSLTRGWGGAAMDVDVSSPVASGMGSNGLLYSLASPTARGISTGTRMCDPGVVRSSGSYRQSAPPTDPLIQLISLQQADGSWNLDSEFLGAVSLKPKSLRPLLKHLVMDKQLAGRITATLAALRFLGQHPDREAEWRYLAQKARTWLAGLSVKPPQGSDWEAWLDRALPTI